MAMPVQPLWIGVDVSKATLDISTSQAQAVITLPNTATRIRTWLKSLSGPVCLGLEATNTFHLELAMQAHAYGFTVYLLNGYRLSKYRESVGMRAKTDPSDARLIRRYVQNEHEDLYPWTPPPKGYMSVQRLLHRRATLVQARTTLSQSLGGMPELKTSVASMLRKMDHLDQLICKRLKQALVKLDWYRHARRCQAIEGIGPVNSMALTTLFHRGSFKSADAFIAFIGMDVRVRDSGKCRGRRKLTKRGDPEVRRLLYMAAMTACRSATWKPFYERALARGLTRIQALVALGRKLARIAYALLKTGDSYRPKSREEACTST